MTAGEPDITVVKRELEVHTCDHGEKPLEHTWDTVTKITRSAKRALPKSQHLPTHKRGSQKVSHSVTNTQPRESTKSESANIANIAVFAHAQLTGTALSAGKCDFATFSPSRFGKRYHRPTPERTRVRTTFFCFPDSRRMRHSSHEGERTGAGSTKATSVTLDMCAPPPTASAVGGQVPDVGMPHYRDARMQHRPAQCPSTLYSGWLCTPLQQKLTVGSLC